MCGIPLSLSWRTNHGAEVECLVVSLVPEPFSLDFVQVIPGGIILRPFSGNRQNLGQAYEGPSCTVDTG